MRVAEGWENQDIARCIDARQFVALHKTDEQHIPKGLIARVRPMSFLVPSVASDDQCGGWNEVPESCVSFEEVIQALRTQ
jgi:hypothetical protein